MAYEAILELDQLISVKEEISGLITVSVLMQDPDLASKIANYIAEFVKDFISLADSSICLRNDATSLFTFSISESFDAIVDSNSFADFSNTFISFTVFSNFISNAFVASDPCFACCDDELFNSLMGDDVEPRKIFIDENAKFVVNLDV